MNPAEIFLHLVGSKGIGRALIASFAKAEELLEKDAELARDSLLVIARTLPPTPEWRGLTEALEEMFSDAPQGTTRLRGLLTTEKEQIQAQLTSLNLRASKVSGGWNEDLEREYNELLEKLRTLK